MKHLLIRFSVVLAILFSVNDISFAQGSERIEIRLDSVWVPIHGDTLFGILLDDYFTDKKVFLKRFSKQ